MGECISKQILELAPENAAGYMLLSNIYAAVGNTISARMLNSIGRQEV
jgi:hypothetical protein